MRELFGVLLLGASVMVPLLNWRARYGHWRPTRIADLVEGARVKLRGTVELIERPLRAPFVDVECVAYEIWREDPPPLDEIAEYERGQDFILREAGGDHVLVRIGEQFGLHGGVQLYHYDSGSVECRALMPGARVDVIGVATREVAPEGDGASYREPPRRWALQGTATQPLVIFARQPRRLRS
jgi:hypothetical protein